RATRRPDQHPEHQEALAGSDEYRMSLREQTKTASASRETPAVCIDYFSVPAGHTLRRDQDTRGDKTPKRSPTGRGGPAQVNSPSPKEGESSPFPRRLIRVDSVPSRSQAKGCTRPGGNQAILCPICHAWHRSHR